MFVKVFKDDILEGLQKAANIIPAKTGAAFLRTIWLKAEGEGVSIMATDSNLEFHGSYAAEVVEEGLAGVQGRSFYDLVRKLPQGQIALKLDTEKRNLLIEQGSRKYKLPTNEVSWFQNFSAFPDEGEPVVWSGDFLTELIDRIRFCISDEDTMEAISCLSMKPASGSGGPGATNTGATEEAGEAKAIEACGLNGHQFAMLRFLNDDIAAILPEDGVLIQKKYVDELKKWLSFSEVELAMGGKRLFFRAQSGGAGAAGGPGATAMQARETFSLPLSYYQYPDYKNFLAKLGADEVSTLEVDRVELTESLERLLIFNTDNNRCTYFDMDGTELTLSSQGHDVGTANEVLEAGYAGALKRIAFPTRNLIEITGHFGSERLKLTLTGAEGPCGITGADDPDYLVIIMPMKIVEETYYSEEEA